MINYSIYPSELLFADFDDFEVNYEELTLEDGTTIMVERIDDKQVKVSQIISSDPQCFLRKDIQPGTILKTNLQIP